MNKLIKNELIKIFNKKSIYIMFAILLLFVLLTNIIYKYKLDDYGNYKDNTYDKAYLNSLEDKLKEEKNEEKKLNLENEILTVKLYLKYGINSWQAYIIENKMSDIINGFNFQNPLFVNEYNNIITKFNNNDWKYFVKYDLEEIENALTNIGNNEYTNKKLNINKNILEYRLNNNINYSNNYLNKELENYYSFKIKELNNNKNKYDDYNIKKNIAVSKYILDNKINSNKIADTRGILKNLFVEYELIMIIIIVMISSLIVSQEFTTKTIKQLLITPYNRNEILLSKYITTILMLLMIILVTIILELVIGGIFFGLSSLEIPVIIYNFNKNIIFEYNIFYYIFILVISKIPLFIIISTIIFLISIISLNGTLSIVLGIFIYILSDVFNTIALNTKLLSYFITTNWDFSQYLFGMVPQNIYIDISTSIVIYIIYLFIFILLSFIIFNKKEIKNI